MPRGSPILTPGLARAAASVMLVVGLGAAGAQPAGQPTTNPTKIFTPYADAVPIFRALQEARWPDAFRRLSDDARETAWPAWAAARDRDIRDRLRGGDEDSVVHLLLYGTSFTKTPRATARDLAALVTMPSSALGPLRLRLEDFATAVRSPGGNERLLFARQVITAHGVDVDKPADLIRYLESRVLAIGTTTERTARVLAAAPDPIDQLTAFRDRGLSSDTSLFVDFGVERSLEALRATGTFGEGAIRRVAIIGPGLDFTDKFEGYDFYPTQTIQPFAVIDSLRRLRLAATDLSVTAFDLSPRVLQHLAIARQQAQKGQSYLLTLPRSLERPWAPDLEQYWRRFGDTIGEAGESLRVPPNAGRVEGRRIRVRPDAVLRIASHDLDIVVERMDKSSLAQFDLIVTTNVFLYYDIFEQALAAANTAAMLAPNGRLLTNNRLFEAPDGPLEESATTNVTYVRLPGVGDTSEQFVTYRLSRR